VTKRHIRKPGSSEVQPEVSRVLICVILRKNLDEEQMFWRGEKSLTPAWI
jgi:hypothetical protein